MYTIDIATGETKVIHRSNDWLNHLQCSPTDPAADSVLPRRPLALCRSHLDHAHRRHGTDAGPSADDRHGDRRPRVLQPRRQRRCGTTCRRRGAWCSGWPGTTSPRASGPGTTTSATSGRSTTTSRRMANCSPATAVGRIVGRKQESQRRRQARPAGNGQWIYLFRPELNQIDRPARASGEAGENRRARAERLVDLSTTTTTWNRT